MVFAAAVVVWFLQCFTPALTVAKDAHESILAAIATWIAPVFSPLGFGDWRITTALIAGFMAKEIVVATLSVLFGSTAQLLATLTPLSVVSLLVFCLLYTPCVAAIAAIRHELGGRWALGIVAFQCGIAYLVALLVHVVGALLGFA